MYNSIIIVDSNLIQTKKDVIYAVKKNNALILEFNYSSTSYEELKNEINEIYQDREILGNDLELQNILFVNTDFEHTNLFQSYLKGKKSVLHNPDINDPAFLSWTNIIDLIQYCKNTFSLLKSFDILDINHLYYKQAWRRIFEKIETDCDISNSDMNINYLSKTINMDENNMNILNSTNNWLKTIFYDFYDANENIRNLIDTYFTKENETNINLLNNTTSFNIEATPTLCNNYSLNTYVSGKIRILIIPCVQQANNEKLALLVNQLNQQSQNEILPLFLNDNESFETFSQKFTTLYSTFVSNINTSNQYELYFGIYLPPYWNDNENPSNIISLSNNLQTISLELTSNQSTSTSIFSNIIQLIKSQYSYISKIYFEFFNLSQNYSNNLNLIYKNLSTQEEYINFVGFYFSYITHIENDYNLYIPEYDSQKTTQDYLNNMLYYNNGTISYNYYDDDIKHNIESFLNVDESSTFQAHNFIEIVKIHNIILFNEELYEIIDEIQKSLSPNTLLLVFSPSETTYESMKQKLLNLNQEPNVDINSIALFQHSQQSNNEFLFLSNESYLLTDTSLNDPELNLWSNFIDFTLFLQNEIGASNFDLLMCKIYSDPNWAYVINKIENQLTSLNIRSSDDNTGHVIFDGDWVLESENVDVNMIYLYFNESILDVEIELAYNSTNLRIIVMDNVNHKIYGAGNFTGHLLYYLAPGGNRGYMDELPLPTLNSGEHITAFSYGSYQVIVLTNQQRIFAIGRNDSYMFTNDYVLNQKYNSAWIEIDTSFIGSNKIVHILAVSSSNSNQYSRTYVLLDNGDLYMTGKTRYYSNSVQKYYFTSSTNPLETFTKLTLPTGETGVKKFMAGSVHLHIITFSNTAYILTSETTWNESKPPGGFDTGDYVVDMTTGKDHFLLTNSGKVYYKGQNSHYQSGSGSGVSTTYQYTDYTEIDWPNQVPYQYTDEYPVKISNGWGATQMVSNYNNLYNVGLSVNGQRGNSINSNADSYKPTWFRVQSDIDGNSLVGKALTPMHSTNKGSYFISTDGYLYSTGKNDNGGKLGVNHAKNTINTQYERAKFSNNQELTGITNFMNTYIEYGSTTTTTTTTPFTMNLISSFNTTVDDSSATVLHFDSDSSYSDASYVFTTGIYKITNVPSSTPLALINNGQTDHIVYGGTTTESTSAGPDTNNYDFVSGTMYIEIDSSFDPISFYTTANSGSYLGTQGDIIYTADTSYENITIDSGNATTVELDTSQFFNIFKDTSSNYFSILSNANEISGNVYKNYNFSNYDTFNITNIPEQYKLAFVEISSSDISYTGDNSKKSSHNIDGVSYDFYYGDISINASNGFKTLKMYVYNSLKSTVIELQNNISGKIIECLDISSSLSVSDSKYLLNGNTSYDEDKSFGVYIGSYEIHNVPASHPLAILNNDVSNNVTYTGTTLQGNQVVDGNTYNYYSGTLRLNIEDDFTSDLSALSLHCLNHGYMGGQNKIVFSSKCSNETPGYYIECLDVSNSFNIVNSGGNKLILNNGTSYDTNRRFGVSIGNYEIHNVSSSHPIAFLNNDISDIVTYDGSFVETDTVGGISYNFYSGTVQLVIEQDFTSTLSALSYYCANHGYMGGQDKIVFSSLCDGKTPDYYIECLDISNSFNIVNSGGNKLVLNNGTSYDTNRRFGVSIGNYEIHNVSSSHPIAFLNNDISDIVTYDGSFVETDTVGGISYNFYSGTVQLIIEQDFTSTLSALSYYCANHGYMGGQDKIIFSSLCDGKTPGYYIECLDASNNVNVVNSGGNKYLFNNSSVYETNRRFGLTSGTYYLNNISTSHPMAILNNDVSDVVTYTGSNATSAQVSGVSYNFYSGTITLTISGEFSGSLSAYCSNHGYMGCENKFVYTNLCVGKSGTPQTPQTSEEEEEEKKEEEEEEVPINKTCLRTNTIISIPASISSTTGIILNYGYVNVYDSTLLYGLDIGNYLIKNIPKETPLAIFNYDISSSVQYTGDVLQLNVFNSNQGRKYNYYSGDVRLIVKSLPTDVSYLSYGIFKNKEFYDETNKFIFDSECSTDDYYYDCIKSHSTIELSNNVIHINNKNYESGNNKLALYEGYVEFRHVPEENPIAFISISNSNDISYQGLEYNKVTLTINSQNVDFYHGNVVLRILRNFDNDLTVHMKQTGVNTTSTMNLYYSDYCDYSTSYISLYPTIECLDFDNSMNITELSKRRHIGFNLESDPVITTQRIYGFNVGLYKFNNISQENAIRITNISNGDVFLSSSEVAEVQGINDISSNDYYYGDVFLHVTTDVSYLSLNNSNGIEFQTSQYSNLYGKDILFYTNECLTDESFYISCLKQTSDVSVNGGYLILNDDSQYSSTRKYGLYLGNYVINNISSSHPLALLNNDISNLVVYSGSTLESTSNVNGIPYNFYSGSMYITVKGNFNSIDPSGLSLYCSNHGYMGAENIFKYSELCSSIGEGYYIEDLSNTMTFNKVNDKLLLNNESAYNENKKYGFYVGTYTITNVPEEDAIALTNKDYLNKISYTGTQLKGEALIEDVSYSFYYGTITIKVFEPFDGAKNIYPPIAELSFYSFTNGYLGGFEKLVYYDIPRNYNNLSLTICLDEQSVTKIYNADNSDNYTFNDSANYYDYKKYGMSIGKYILKDVPISEPIALLNKDVSNVIIYNGKSNKKVTANDPSGNSIDFFYGNVEIEVTGDFGNLSVYSANGKYLGGENIFTFSESCGTTDFVIECLELESSMNIYDNKFTLNNASFYNQFKKYGLTTGSYRITNIPSSQALTFINNDLSDAVIVTGDNIDLCGNYTGPDGNNYNFYTNEINLTINKEFTGFLSLYSYSDSSYNNGFELFKYSDLCTSINPRQTFIHSLNNETANDISLSSNDTTKIILDSNLTNYNASLKYGVFTGNYIFNVPSSHPIAFLNFDISNNVSYFGNEENKSLGTAPRGNENIEYEFYHGRVILNIFGNFNTLSYYIKNDNDPSGGSYMGGLNAIKYSNFCDDQQSTTGISCLTKTSSFNLIENGGSYVYTLNNDSSIVNNRNYGVHENIYTLTDICENYPIAILNNGVEEKINYGGETTDLCGNFTAPDGNNYDFYKNQIIVSVSDSSFNNLSFYVHNPPNSGYFGLQNKLVYSDLCEDTVAETDEIIEDILTTSFDKQAS